MREVLQVPILSYHKVDQEALSEWWVTTEQFARQMDVLQAYGYTTISLQDYINYQNGTGTLPERPVLITFDDGYQDIYTQAFPVLASRGMTATLFIPTDFIGDTEAERQDNSWDAGEPLAYHLIWPEIESLYAAGFSIESHSVHHPALEGLNPDEAREEINQSRLDLQAHLPGDPVYFFAYPYGSGADDPVIRRLIAEAGYQAAVGYGTGYDEIAEPGVSDIWALPRRGISRGVSLDLNPLDPWWFFMRRVDPDFPLPFLGTELPKVFDAYGSERDRFYAGEQITVTLEADNWDVPANVTASLAIANQDGMVYDSHTAGWDIHLNPIPSGDMAATFAYPWTIPLTGTLGQYTTTFQVYDEYYLLRYYYSTPQPVVEVEPLPISVTADVSQINLMGIETQPVTFSITNTAPPAEQTYLTISLSPGLRINQVGLGDGWKYYPPGSLVKADGCDKPCLVTENAIYELFLDSFDTGTQSFTLNLTSAPGAGASEWLKYRLSMHLPEGSLLPDWYLRDPLAGEPDQQGWAAREIPVRVNRDDVYLPIVKR